MLRFMICDDDDAFCEKEQELVYRFFRERNIRIGIDRYRSGKEVIALGEELSSYNVIFLGVNMKKENSMDLSSWLVGAAPELVIVLIAGSMDYALDGYKVGAARYIMKDDRRFESSIEECLKYILRRFRKGQPDYIAISDGNIRVSVDKVLYVESNAHKLIYHLIRNGDTRQEYTVYGKLGDAETNMREFGFCRVHQSYLVNMNYAREVMRYQVMLLDGTGIQISKKNYKAVQDEFVRVKGTF